MADDPGVYQLHLYLAEAARVTVGKLGTFLFPAGRYVYTGSALSGLERRLARHWRQEKRLHWHIDYLLRHGRIEAITVIPTRERLECTLNGQALDKPGARVIAAGFGSSDCGCRTHLVYLGVTCDGKGESTLATDDAQSGKMDMLDEPISMSALPHRCYRTYLARPIG